MINTVIIFALIAAQVISGGIKINGGVALGSTTSPGPPPPSGTAQLPTSWANSHECDPPGGTYNVIKTIGVDYPDTTAGLNQSMTDWVAAPDQWWHVIVPHGHLYAGGGQPNGTFTLQAKTGATKCIVYESDTPLPSATTVCAHGIQDNLGPSTDIGARNLGCTNDISKMWTVECTASACNAVGVVDGTLGANHIAIRDLEARPNASNIHVNSVVRMGKGNTTIAALPSHIHLSRIYIHGDVNFTGSAITGPGNNLVSSAGLSFNCVFCSFMNSYIDRLYRGADGADYQDIVMSNNPGPFKIVHNFLEGTSEPLLCGGSTPNIPGINSCQDMEFRRNHIMKPPELMGTSNPAGGSWLFKNLFELKECLRCLVDGNILEYNDASGGQGGPGFVINVRACSAGIPCDNQAATVQDLTLTNNITRHTCRIGGGDGQTGGGSAGVSVGFGAQRWYYFNNLKYDAQLANFAGAGANDCSHASPAVGLNVNSSGYTWSASTATRAAGVVTYTLLPGGTGAGIGNFNIGDPVYVQGCVDTSFNTTINTLGPAAISPTTPTSNQVTIALIGAGLSTTGCQVTNRQSYTRNFIRSHNTVIAENAAFNPTSTNGTSALIFQQNSTFTDDIFIGGGWNTQGNGIAEGTQEENKMWDSSTLTVNHVIFPQRPSTKYTQYPEGFDFSVVTACVSPGVPVGCVGSMYFPVLNNDIKFKTTFGLNLADWHNYALDPTSNFHNAGSDGTDIGVNIPALDAAQTATQYNCQTACGTGSFPD